MANNIGKKQIATYENKVVEIVPEYKQKGAPKETITITKTSVIQETYAPYSNNEQTEGMYIQAHTINDSNYRTGDWNEYEPHQLVAKDDLNYRFLLPTGEDSTSPTYNALLALCVNSSNTNRTISRDEGHNTYETTLTPKTGYSKVPAGRVEKQKGNGTWESVYSWNTPLDSVTIRIQDVDGNLRFVFNSNCIYELTVYTTVDGVIQPNPSVIEGICETPINVDNYAQSIPGKTFVNITKDGTPISGEQDFCRNTSIYVNYTTNEYTVTNRIDPNCATVEISNPTPEYGDTVDITITKTSDKANIGAGSISMVGADNPIYSWNKIVGPISYRVNSVIGSITIDSDECGDPANHPVQLEWYNDEEPESNPVITSINVSHGSIIHPNDSDCTSTFTLPTGYEIKHSIPDMDSAITITDDNTVIQYHYGLKKYKVTYTGDSTVTINIRESDEVKHGEAITTRNVYTIESGYQNATATIISGTATGASTDNGSVTVTGVTSNVTVRISADSIPTHNYCVSFSIEQAGTIGGDEPYCSTIQEGTCHEDISYSLNSGYEIYGEIPSQITINADNTIDVCNITEDVNLIIPVRLVTHTVKYCLTDGSGMTLEGASGGECVTKTVTHGQNSSEEFDFRSGYNSVIIDSITPQDKPYNIDYGNNTININNITENVEIWMHAGAIPDQNVTFKLFIDGVEQPDRETTRSVPYGSTANNAFRSLGIVIDRTDINVTADVAGVTTDYNVLSDVAIGVSGTPITEATVIITYLKSVQQKTVTNIYASGMDAMGGVIFQAKFDDGTYDSDQNKFSVSYSDNNGNTSTSKDVVDVFDYSLNTGTLDEEDGKYISEAKGIYQKSKLDLDYPTQVRNRTCQVTVIYQDHSETMNIIQRAENYGYYTNGNDVFDASSSSNDLKSATWKTNELVDYGDSSNMYGGSDLDTSLKGLDGYNKDITPYYVTGTYIGENPLDHLTNNEGGTITGTNKPSGVSTYNSSENTQYNEHYHITWNEAGWNKAFRKGYIFSYDGIGSDAGFCGGLPGDYTEGDCIGTGLQDTTHTLEAISNESDHRITTNSDWTYTAYYHIPSHKYGRDAISYYHINNSEYRWNINSENNPFKDANENTLTFSYPLHIFSNYDLEKGVEIDGTGSISAWGAGPTSYALSTVRWRTTESDPSNYVPDDSGYTLYEQSIHPAYYDYNNKLYLDNSTDTVIFDPYNNNLYEEDSEASATQIQVGQTGKQADKGRRVDIYYSLMSPETLIRPRTENGVTKFGVLSGVYNGIDYSEYEGKMYSVGVSDYIANNGLFGRTRYISQHSWNSAENESREPTNDISIENYPYTISGTNENYNRYYDSEHDTYETLMTRPSEDTILEHCWYNLVNNITFDQYYNTQDIKNNYFHTSSQAKYIDCSVSFDTGEYEKYDINDSSKTWEEVVLEGITSIVKNQEESTSYHTVYIITTNENVYSNCTRAYSYNKGTYYHRDTVNVGTYYTNANHIELSGLVSITWGDCFNCGVGSVTWTINDGSNTYTDTQNYSSSTILTFDNPNGNPLTIQLEVNTNDKEYDKGSDDPYVEGDEEYHVSTGGTLLSMYATWDNGDTRRIDVGVEGSSKYGTGNPGESGPTILTWKDLNDYFSENRSGETNFTNSGRTLYHKIQPTE